MWLVRERYRERQTVGRLPAKCEYHQGENYMARAKLLIVIVAAALLGIFAVPAAAQDGQTLESDPPSVDAAGEHTVTINGSGFTIIPIFVLPCPGAEGDIAAASQENCDTSNLTTATPDADGNFSVEVTYEIPEVGLVVSAGEATGAESAATVITVGDGGGEGEAEEDAEEAVEEAEEDVEEAEEAEVTAELAQTGSESGLIAIIAVSVIAAGAMIFMLGRKARHLR